MNDIIKIIGLFLPILLVLFLLLPSVRFLGYFLNLVNDFLYNLGRESTK